MLVPGSELRNIVSCPVPSPHQPWSHHSATLSTPPPSVLGQGVRERGMGKIGASELRPRSLSVTTRGLALQVEEGQHLLSTYCVPGPVSGHGGTAVTELRMRGGKANQRRDLWLYC